MVEKIQSSNNYTVTLTNPMLAPLSELIKKKSRIISQPNQEDSSALAETKIVVSTVWENMSEDFLQFFPNVSTVCNLAIGTDNIDFDYLNTRDIKCLHLPNLGSEDTAELALALMLSLSRNIISNHHFVKNRNWIASNSIPLGSSLAKKRCGILGLGRIGQSIAVKASAFGMEIHYHSRHKKDTPYTYHQSVLNLAQHVDYLVISCSGNNDTYQIVNKSVLTHLGPNGFLINVARGIIVDDDALIHCLNNKLIRGAALDVFNAEPNISEQYHELDNIILSPHMGSRTVENITHMFEEMARMINALEA